MWRKTFLWVLAFVLLTGCVAPLGSQPPATVARPTVSPTGETGQSTLAQIKKKGVLIVGTAITKPFEFRDPNTNALIGFDVDITQYIAGKLGLRLEWVEMPFASLIPSLQDRKVDMTIAAIYITPEREALADFAESYINTGLVMVVVRPDLASQVKTAKDLARLKVGVKIGATGHKLAQELVAQGIALEIREYKETLDSFLDLEVGRVDVVLNDYLNTLAYLKDSRSRAKIVTTDTGEVNFLSRAGLGLAIHKGDQELLGAINAALKEMREDGTFDKLYEKWLKPTGGG